MAKAKYHKSQRVFVKPVGTWACVEAVVPKWVEGCEEPIKVAYECGMGREFAQEELEEEATAPRPTPVKGSAPGRDRRARAPSEVCRSPGATRGRSMTERGLTSGISPGTFIPCAANFGIRRAPL